AARCGTASQRPTSQVVAHREPNIEQVVQNRLRFKPARLSRPAKSEARHYDMELTLTAHSGDEAIARRLHGSTQEFHLAQGQIQGWARSPEASEPDLRTVVDPTRLSFVSILALRASPKSGSGRFSVHPRCLEEIDFDPALGSPPQNVGKLSGGIGAPPRMRGK